jgi:hypothetical protein
MPTVMIWSHLKGDRIETSPNDYLDWQKQSTVFQSLNASTGRGLTIATPDWTEQVLANRVAPGFFDLLSREKAYLSRTPLPARSYRVGNDHGAII